MNTQSQKTVPAPRGGRAAAANAGLPTWGRVSRTGNLIIPEFKLRGSRGFFTKTGEFRLFFVLTPEGLKAAPVVARQTKGFAPDCEWFFAVPKHGFIVKAVFEKAHGEVLPLRTYPEGWEGEVKKALGARFSPGEYEAATELVRGWKSDVVKFLSEDLTADAAEEIAEFLADKWDSEMARLAGPAWAAAEKPRYCGPIGETPGAAEDSLWDFLRARQEAALDFLAGYRPGGSRGVPELPAGWPDFRERKVLADEALGEDVDPREWISLGDLARVDYPHGVAGAAFQFANFRPTRQRGLRIRPYVYAGENARNLTSAPTT